MPCPGRILTERADPIVSPGSVSGHVHTISGGNGFGFEMDYEQARTSTCSSCPIKQDLSNYWTPALYYQYQNGSFENVPQVGDSVGSYGGMTVYYLQRPGPNNDALKAFPEGFRMLAGDPFKRNRTDDFESDAVSFVCLDYSSTSPQTHGFPTGNCPDGIRAQIFFPSCWDGVNLDSSDHKSHVSYPASGSNDNGPCPASHPVHLVSLFYEVIYDTSNFADKWYGSGQPFVFAMGDATGYGMHGDFVNGWDVDALQTAVDTCNNDSGLLSDCPVFEYFTNAESKACVVPPSIDEAVTGVLDKLPGCNPVTDGPEEAAILSCDNPPIGAYKEYFTDVTSSLGYGYVGCGSDGTTRTLSAASESGSDMDVETCVSFCSDKGYAYAGMEYASQCYCGDSVPSDKAPVEHIVGNCFSPCAGNSSEYCGGSNALSLYKKCDGGSCTNALYTPPYGSASSSSSDTSSSSSGNSTSTSSSVSSASSASSVSSASSSAASSSTVASSTSASSSSSAPASSTTSATATSASSSSSTSSSATATSTAKAKHRKQKQGWTARQRSRFAAARAAHEIAEREADEVEATLAEAMNA
ncbi:hypothetical protein AAFC00_004750 [Neodothiora populina]|uniref:WSC domain-containing protein n=1 Tax=Neodothiora populina TaxID=2781224 RepID=A0ABR3P321_9PEZI